MNLPTFSQVTARFRSLYNVHQDVIDSAVAFVERDNPSANLPYHSARHMVSVAVMSAYLLHHEMLYDEMSETPLEVVLAALFHDVCHSGRPDTQEPNIEAAVRAWATWFDGAADTLSAAGVRCNTVAQLIQATSFPTRKPTSLGEKILMTADLYSNVLALYPEKEKSEFPFKTVNMHDFILGLADEEALRTGVRLPLKEAFRNQMHFWRNMRFAQNPDMICQTALTWYREGLVNDFERAFKVFYQTNKDLPVYRAAELDWILHGMERHPDYEYQSVITARKSMHEPPEGIGWIPNPARGRERDDYIDIFYYMRPRIVAQRCNTYLSKLPPVTLPKLTLHDFVNYLRSYLQEHRIEGGAIADGFHSKAEYVERADDILGAHGRDSAEIYFLVSTDWNYDEPKKSPIPLRMGSEHKFGYLRVDLDRWMICVDLADPIHGTYVKDRSGIDHWYHWTVDSHESFDLPINTYMLKQLIEERL